MTNQQQENPYETLRRLAKAAGDALNADVVIYSGVLERPSADKLIIGCKSYGSHTNVLLILSTYGGDPDAAYRIARFLQARYERFTLFVNGYCKSAGTLIALGADELVMSEFGELGPLDTQVKDPNEVGERSSGLDVSAALAELQELSYDAFNANFRKLRDEFEFTAKTAVEVATAMSIGLFKEVYGQIEPMQLGQNARAVRIALDYGERLLGNRARANATTESARRLVISYNSHSFVIDGQEARTLFTRVRGPHAVEAAVADYMMFATRQPWHLGDEPFIFCYGKEVADVAGDAEASAGDAPRVSREDGGASQGTPEVSSNSRTEAGQPS